MEHLKVSQVETVESVHVKHLAILVCYEMYLVCTLKTMLNDKSQSFWLQGRFVQENQNAKHKKNFFCELKLWISTSYLDIMITEDQWEDIIKIEESHANFPTEEDPTHETQSENSETFNESGDDNILVAENFEI